MADSNEPMIRLEPGGRAPILSYNVPEPTSYSGRNFIDLQLPESYFITEAASLTSGEPRSRQRGSATDTLELLRAAAEAGNERLSPELARLQSAEVEAMAAAGKELNVYRSMYGTLAYNFVSKPAREEPALAAGPTALAAPRLRPNDPNDPEPDPEFPILIAIMAPTAGAAVSGPHTGVTVDISGFASVSTGSLAKVEVQVGSGAFQRATLSGDGTWAFRATITASGSVTITAKATKSGSTLTARDMVTFNVTLAPPPDTTPASVSITSPTNGTTLLGDASGVQITVAGVAADANGVRSVEVKVDEAGTFSPATPRAVGDWSSWTKQLSLTPGAHTITARAADNAGNLSHASVTMTVTVAPPADTGGPAVAITSPVNGADVTGPFHGVTVAISGTASDPSGIRLVDLSLDNVPVYVPAQAGVPGDWSTWTGSLVISEPGSHVITARSTDNANNVGEASIAIEVTLIPDVVSRFSRLILVESYRLSSYLGAYGAGKTIKTFSLLPGEKTRLSVKSYTRSEQDAKSASSILDSFTQESASDFETSMSNEQSDKQSYDESFNYKVGAEAQASWGWGSAKVSGEVSGGTNAAREEFAKNISNATEKHAAKASAKRDVQINTSYEVKTQTGEETSLEREIENINVSRTLNFVFRQMNQEFISILHLVDVRVGFFKVTEVNGMDEYAYREVTLPQIAALLREVIVEEKRSEVLSAIVYQLTNIFDDKDRHHRFVEEEPLKDRDGKAVPASQYLRVKKEYVSTYLDDATGTTITVPGIILAANKHVLRTEGLIVDALLGQGDGLDAYSHGLQDEAVRARSLENARTEAEVKRLRLANRIIEEGDEAAAKIYAILFAPRAEQEEGATAVSSVAPNEEKVNGRRG